VLFEISFLTFTVVLSLVFVDFGFSVTYILLALAIMLVISANSKYKKTNLIGVLSDIVGSIVASFMLTSTIFAGFVYTFNLTDYTATNTIVSFVASAAIAYLLYKKSVNYINS
jgi:vacuolar-type H+-ATPase subunit I/STV1